MAEVLSELKHKQVYYDDVPAKLGGPSSLFPASAQAREEFPDFNVEERRSAVSIAPAVTKIR